MRIRLSQPPAGDWLAGDWADLGNKLQRVWFQQLVTYVRLTSWPCTVHWSRPAHPLNFNWVEFNITFVLSDHSSNQPPPKIVVELQQQLQLKLSWVWYYFCFIRPPTHLTNQPTTHPPPNHPDLNSNSNFLTSIRTSSITSSLTWAWPSSAPAYFIVKTSSLCNNSHYWLSYQITLNFIYKVFLQLHWYFCLFTSSDLIDIPI